MRSRKRPKQKRVRNFEKLETRRLLVGEGDLFQVQEAISNNGLLGNVTGEIRWGDGVTAPLSLTGDTSVATSGIKVVIDYDLDDNRFFSQPGARQALQYAADVVSSRFQDQLAAIRPSPSGLSGLSYRPFIQHPSQGPSDQAVGNQISVNSDRDVVVNANEIRLYAGGRNLRQRAPDGSLFDVAAFGGPGDIDTDPVTCNPDCATTSRRIDQFKARGQPGVLASTPTDIAPAFAQISFNTTLDWDFSINGDSVQPGKFDFLTVAMHELAHVFGFSTSSVWNSKVRAGRFTGTNAVAAYQGSGGVPLVGNSHWAASVFDIQPTLLTSQVQTSKGRALSDLDFAALRDLGWQVRSEGSVAFNVNHRYADNGQYNASVVLRGSEGGEQVYPLDPITIDNVAPILSPSQTFSVPIGVDFQAENIGVISDAGINDTFTYEIDWGDQSQDSGVATIDSLGDDNGMATEASFDGSHTYQTDGVKTVTLTVTDKDGATDEATFQITVTPPPLLTLQLNRGTVTEDAGADAANLIIRRSGPVRNAPQRVDLQSSDPSEVRLPSTVDIPAGQTQVVVPVQAVDDDLLDGPQTALLTATGLNLQSGEISISVNDAESITARFNRSQFTEGQTGTTVRIERSNTDVSEPLNVSVSAFDRAQFDFADPLVIPAGEAGVTVSLVTVDNNIAEQPETFDVQFRASGYVGANAVIELIDDDPAPFQNPVNRFDVNDDSGVTANDALVVINALSRRNGNDALDPNTEQPNGVFLDVNGDFRVTASDALQIINELGRQSARESEQGSAALPPIDGKRTTDRLHDEAIGLMF